MSSIVGQNATQHPAGACDVRIRCEHLPNRRAPPCHTPTRAECTRRSSRTPWLRCLDRRPRNEDSDPITKPNVGCPLSELRLGSRLASPSVSSRPKRQSLCAPASRTIPSLFPGCLVFCLTVCRVASASALSALSICVSRGHQQQSSGPLLYHLVSRDLSAPCGPRWKGHCRSALLTPAQFHCYDLVPSFVKLGDVMAWTRTQRPLPKSG